MVLYEVVVDVENSVREDFIRWLRDHIQEMLTFEGFQDAWMLEKNPQGTNARCCLKLHYLVKTQKALDDYLKNHAESMRQKGVDKFEGLFSIERHVYTCLT